MFMTLTVASTLTAAVEPDTPQVRGVTRAVVTLPCNMSCPVFLGEAGRHAVDSVSVWHLTL